MFRYHLVPPLLFGLALWHWVSGRDTLSDLRERVVGPRPAGPVLWLHGASNGELGSARPLIEALIARDPERRILVTANTSSGRDLVAGWGLDRLEAAMAPIDRAAPARQIMRNATGLILLENELWPHRILAAHAARKPVILAAARMSDRSAGLWRRAGPLPGRMLGRVAMVSAQDLESERRLLALGVPGSAVAPRTDLKSLFRPAGILPDGDLAAAFRRERTVLAASTHDGEEHLALTAFQDALAEQPDLKLILAPRHVRRADRTAELARALGFDVARRSFGDAPEAQVYLADTMGEMELWYRLAAVAFVGGSITDRGGHTPYEPAALGCAILHGPSTRNFSDAYSRLDAGGGAAVVQDARSLAAAWLQNLEESPLPARASLLLERGDLDALVDRIEAALATPAPR